jgi:hypothetical protein
MATPATVRRGVVHGKTIELDEETRLSDGQEVNVIVQPIKPGDQHLPPGEGLRRAFGGWAEETEELDAYLEWNRQQRKMSRPEIAP